jgi:hypothetical protein
VCVSTVELCVSLQHPLSCHSPNRQILKQPQQTAHAPAAASQQQAGPSRLVSAWLIDIYAHCRCKCCCCCLSCSCYPKPGDARADQQQDSRRQGETPLLLLLLLSLLRFRLLRLPSLLGGACLVAPQTHTGLRTAAAPTHHLQHCPSVLWTPHAPRMRPRCFPVVSTILTGRPLAPAPGVSSLPATGPGPAVHAATAQHAVPHREPSVSQEGVQVRGLTQPEGSGWQHTLVPVVHELQLTNAKERQPTDCVGVCEG